MTPTSRPAPRSTGPSPSVPRPHPAAPRSPDGAWWWDGAQWWPTGEAPATAAVGRRRTRTAVIVSVLVALVVLVNAGLAALAIPLYRQERDRSVETALRLAAGAQERVRVDGPTYTRDVATLVEHGYAPDGVVDVTVVSATADEYCLAAGLQGEDPVQWFASDTGPSAVPCD